MKKILFSILFFTTVGFAAASLSPGEEERAQKLGHQLRCPVCRGVAIAESPAELANKMMASVREQIVEGKSDQEILYYFEERYGEWALLQPKAEGINLAIWILPALFVIGGAGIILYRLKKGVHS
ncbi:MAG: cytochrome c-type biogenesis protein CcmH [Deltaproteobacteria bacterium]|nr:cytochrome c-type biogenesis protein CcmH [Deltaproteobacteria bacterium]